MARWCSFSVMAFILFVVWGCGKSSSLEGHVVDGKGQPMPKLKVIAKQVQPIKGYERVETTTVGDGKFALTGLFPTASYEIEIFPNSESLPVALCFEVESGPEGQTKLLPKPLQIRFTKDKDGVITDSATGLEWYVGPDQANRWNIVKSWTENLSVAGGGWRMPTFQELEYLFKGGSGGQQNIVLFFKPSATLVRSIWSGDLRDVEAAWQIPLKGSKQDLLTSLTRSREWPTFAVRSKK